MVNLVSKDYFKINGISSNSVGIFVDTPSIQPKAKQRVSVSKTGNDEDLYTPDNIYDPIKYKLIFYTFDRETFDNSDIYAFLADAKTLEVSRLPGFYFRVLQVSEVTAERWDDGKYVKYTVIFTLSSFKYKTDNEWITLSSGDIVTNTGTRYCKPTLEITGANETDFIFNGKIFKLFFSSEGQTVIVDSERKTVYDKNAKAYLWNFVAGEYPFLSVGDTQVVWYNPADVKIRKNERCY